MDFVSWSNIVAKKAKGRIEMAKSVAKDDVDAGEEGKRSKDEQANDEMYSPSSSVAPGRQINFLASFLLPEDGFISGKRDQVVPDGHPPMWTLGHLFTLENGLVDFFPYSIVIIRASFGGSGIAGGNSISGVFRLCRPNLLEIRARSRGIQSGGVLMKIW
ncbi:hypothetical protein M407DRAFT_245376 [Tulasnella calospora MUT 4182]|uniref:Uncharacterized protein n=1 Tax=Tulasnella calospora MUT 4182 TaxID=1051891 RepID=A0A0C3Q132_9AGAM|nr:hypothetical protein M407DRAFT_245376 [Tulasnella calospora MUT 4182]